MFALTTIEIVGVVAELGIGLLLAVLMSVAIRRAFRSRWWIDDQPTLDLDRSHCRYCGHLLLDCRCEQE